MILQPTAFNIVYYICFHPFTTTLQHACYWSLLLQRYDKFFFPSTRVWGSVRQRVGLLQQLYVDITLYGNLPHNGIIEFSGFLQCGRPTA